MHKHNNEGGSKDDEAGWTELRNGDVSVERTHGRTVVRAKVKVYPWGDDLQYLCHIKKGT